MATRNNSPTPPRERGTSRGGKIRTAIIAACALGTGVTGTMTWMQRSAPSASQNAAPATLTPATKPVASVATPNPIAPGFPASLPSASDSAASDSAALDAMLPDSTAPKSAPPDSHDPPAALTFGMTPPQAALALGNWYYDHERWPSAIENYRRVLASGLDNANVRTDLGNALRFAGKPQEALEQYQLAHRRDPTHEPSLFNQGALWAKSLNDPARAIAAWRAYLKEFPAGRSAASAREFIALTEAKAKAPNATSKPR